jgi:dTDP-4-amino-4,6-dideoxygalactose transaminase
MLVSYNENLINYARKLSTQARDAGPHYQHSEVGYNYRLSNLLAAVGRGQLQVLDERVAARRRIFERYREALGDLPGLDFQPEAPWAHPHPLAHLPQHRREEVRRGPGGGPPGSRGPEHRGSPPLEAHAPAAPLPLR